jgi:beta-lactamase regulating signal transducer with metallopeptidase domain/HEAT repeat protein
VKATALLLLAMGITSVLRRAQAGARYVVWLATLLALLLVPAMNAWAPVPLAILPAELVSTRQPVVSVSESKAPAVVSRWPAPVETVEPQPLADRRISATAAAGIAWAYVASLLLGWLLLGAAKVRRILRGARTLTDESWLTPLYETADRLDLDRVPRLVMSSAIEMPFACSILRPTIVLPASAQAWTDERRRVVLFHELAHIRRRDLLGHTLGRIVCAFYWFHPLVWSAAKNLRAESERACDDLVLSCGARASDYANHLLEIVTGVRRHGAPATALPMANRREFEGRMLAILDPGLKRTSPSLGQQLVLAVGLGSLALTIAAVAPVRRAPEVVDRAGALTPPDTTARDVARTRGPDFVPKRAREVASSASIAMAQSSSASTSASSTTTVSESRIAEERQRLAPDTALLGRVLRTDRNGEVRKAAAWALQGRRDGVPLLVERLRADEDARVRETAAWALAGNGSPDVIAVLSEALRADKDDEVRATAAWALGNSRGRADVAQLVAALNDVSEEVRRRALWAIGQQGLRQAPPRAVTLLRDPDSEVRMMAAWVVGQILDRSTLPAVREAFLVERDSDVAHATFRALLFMGERSQAVIDRAMSSEDPEMRARGVRMIAGLGAGVWPWPWPWPWPRPSP